MKPTVSELFVNAALAIPNLDGLAGGLSRAVNATYALAGPRARRLKDALGGTWLGHPLHPAITDVPVGAWTAALALDLLHERRGAKIAVGVGLLGALGAAASGATDWLETSGKPRRLGAVHALLNVGATALYATSFFARSRDGERGVALATLGYALVSLSALYGGALALDMQIGANRAHGVPLPEGEIDIGAISDFAEGALKRVEAGGYPLLAVRREGAVYAIAATCAHQGGPLDEGTLEGDVVACPWHGSQFCVRDGSVVHGPSAYPQPSFPTRIAGERVFVRTAIRGA